MRTWTARSSAALNVTDPDDPGEPFGQHTFTVDDNRFEVVAGNLKLKAGQSLDHEAAATITLNVTADDGDNTTMQEFVIAVNDINEATTAIALDNTDVDENSLGAVIGTLTVTDPDNPTEPFGQPTLTVDDARFEIVSGNLKLKAGQSLDHEAAATITLNVTADDGDNTFVQEFVIDVNDVNEAPTAIDLDNSDVNENSAGAIVGALAVTDPDNPAEPFGQHAFTVNDSRFEVVAGNLKLKAGEALDHETDATVTLTVTVDDGDNTFMQEFVITVNDVNEAPTAIDLDNLNVPENSDGATVGALTVTDPDDPAEPFGQHAFSVDDGRFEVVAGELKLKAGQSLDRETEPAITLTVTATDGDGLMVSQEFTLAVADGNDAPSAISLDNSTVNENAVAAVIGGLTVTDADDPGGPLGQHTLTVDDPRFEIVANQLRLKATESLDHESAATVTVNVTATDGGGLSVTQAFDITVIDINEAPTDIALSDLNVDENATAGSVAAVTVMDPDNPAEPFGQHAFTVSDARFEVVSGQLRLKAGETLDHELEPTVMLNITADDGEFSVTREFVIAVNDVNESPTAIDLDNSIVQENAAGAVIGNVTVTDPDNPAEPFGQHALSVNDARFEVVSGELRLKSGVSLNHEAAATITLNVTADDGDNTFTQAFVITVIDVNESPTAISLGNSNVNENSPGAVVGAVIVTDPDNPAEPFGQHALSVNDARFEIVGGELRLRAGVSLNHEAEPSVTLNITADDGDNTFTQALVVAVTDVNESPTSIALDNLIVSENSPGAAVGSLTVTDPDDPAEPFGQHAFNVDDARFVVVGGELRLRPGQSLDSETEPTIVLNITATDGGGLSTSRVFVLTVADANDPPTAIALDNATVNENAAGASIGALTVTDQDDPGGPLGQHVLTVDDGRFEVVGGVLRLRAGQSLDHETADTVVVNVTATDGGGLAFTQSFAITVVDLNESPTAIMLDNATVNEESSARRWAT